jgi:hypothetical protein
MSSYLDIAYGSDFYTSNQGTNTWKEVNNLPDEHNLPADTDDIPKRTISPLSNLSIDVSREVLLEKYCKLLEFLKKVNGENRKLKEEKENGKQNKIIEQLMKKCNEKDEIIRKLQLQQFSSHVGSDSPVLPTNKEVVHQHIIKEVETLRKRCDFLENNNQMLINELNENKKEENNKLNQQKLQDNEIKKKLMQIRRQQRADRDANYLKNLSLNKKDINNVTNIILTHIPGIAYNLKQRLIAYISKTRINHIEELKGKIQCFGKKRLEILKAIFFCGRNGHTNQDIELPHNEDFEENNLPF